MYSRYGSKKFSPSTRHLVIAPFTLGRRQTDRQNRLSCSLCRFRLKVASKPGLFRGAGQIGGSISLPDYSAIGRRVAEREGFEPPIRLPVCRISSAVHSTTLPPLREVKSLSGPAVFSGGATAKQGFTPDRCGDRCAGVPGAYSSRPSLRSSEYGPPPRSAMAKHNNPHSNTYS